MSASAEEVDTAQAIVVCERRPEDDLGIKRLRLLGAFAVAIASSWLAVIAHSFWLLVWSVIGFGAAAGWIGWILRARRRRNARTAILADADALVVHDEGSVVRVPWDSIARIEVDENRLSVRVDDAEGRVLAHIEALYPRISVCELAVRIERVAQAARMGDDERSRRAFIVRALA